MKQSLASGILFFALFFTACQTQETSALEIGAVAPNFTLQSIDGADVSLSDLKGKTVVLEWFNYGCPFVRKHYDPKHMQKLQTDFGAKEIVWLTINSTHEGHRDFRDVDSTKELVGKHGIASAHVLLDPQGTVGKLYGAKTTPHMFVINAEGALAYQGAIDDDAATDSDPTKSLNYVQSALNAILTGTEPQPAKTKPYGCSVKYSS